LGGSRRILLGKISRNPRDPRGRPLGARPVGWQIWNSCNNPQQFDLCGKTCYNLSLTFANHLLKLVAV
jgi:hypothetical protein